jgi:LysR family transcriptional regulator for bpeEF and oprC
MNQLECMRIFVKVVEHSSISRAARALQVSPATVSTQLTQLERHLQAQLVIRTTRNLNVTDDGATYYSHCKKVLAEIIETEVLLSGDHSDPRGRLRIDASVTFSNRLVLPVLGGFRNRFPGIEVELLHTEHLSDSSQQGFDVMIRLGPLQDSTLVARLLGSVNMLIAASPRYLDKHGEPKNPHELMQHTCLNFIEPLSGRITPWEFRRGDERVTIHPRPGIGFNQGESRLAAALLDMGVYLGMYLNIDHLLNDGSLKAILTDWTASSLPIYVAYSQHRNLSPKVRAFVDYMLDCYPGELAIRATLRAKGDVLRTVTKSVKATRKETKGSR